MKRMLWVIGLAMLVAAEPGRLAADEAALDALAWLEGTWVRQGRRGEVTEVWTRVSPNTMEGHAFVGSGATRRITEHLRLEAFADEVFYVAKPNENPLPTPFALIEATGERFVFENTEHDFPQRIVYQRQENDALLVRIEGPMQGEDRHIDFHFERR